MLIKGKLKSKSNKIISLILSCKDLLGQTQSNRKIGNYSPLNYYFNPFISSLILLLIKAKSLPQEELLKTKGDFSLSFENRRKTTLFMLIRKKWR